MISGGIILRRVRETLHLMVGIPDYERYRQHQMRRHPEAQVMSYEEFFRERQNRRYGGNSGTITRCC